MTSNQPAGAVGELGTQFELLDPALAEKARHFDELPEVREALAAASAPELGQPSADGLSEADALKAQAGELDQLADRGYHNEALDQLVVDVLLGLR